MRSKHTTQNFVLRYPDHYYIERRDGVKLQAQKFKNYMQVANAIEHNSS